MAVGLLFEIAGMTQEQYEGAVQAGGLEDRLPPGQLFHMAGPMEGGWRVIDLWESRADFDRFAQETLAPAMGGQAPVPSQELPVHAFRL
jgi:hypothetical protein